MDRMGLDQDGVIIIHMGVSRLTKCIPINLTSSKSAYGDKNTTLARFKENFEKKVSDAIKRRLVLENDEVCDPKHNHVPLV